MKRIAAKNKTMDLRDPKVREEFLMSEVMKANQKMAEGKTRRCTVLMECSTHRIYIITIVLQNCDGF